uniref:Uncharacterized protein n=1 Tax=Pipistrellus kuhlii TaxID=59472 RepID=A0A7J7ZJD2_PIPKU|nr:hypothetical protein mPipKuh1_009477 [Pipistrellus kuhlii]
MRVMLEVVSPSPVSCSLGLLHNIVSVHRDLVELSESVLHCIDIIKNKSKTAEELILRDLEDTDALSTVFICLKDTFSCENNLPKMKKIKLFKMMVK